MYIKKVHTLIEQGLQDIGVFAYDDFLPEEIDLAINQRLSLFVNGEMQPITEARRQNKQQYKTKLQYFIDRFQNLQVKNLELTPSTDIDQYSVDLPNDYLHLISDTSLVLKECKVTNVATGSIQKDYFYKVKGTKNVIYNSITYNTNQVFIGAEGLTGYTFSGTGNLLLLELCSAKRPNRLTEEEYLTQVLENALEKTDYKSPVSSISGNKLYVYGDNFTIYKIYLTYLRKAKEVNSQFTTYTSGNIATGVIYESVDNNVVYNGNTYTKFQPFIGVTGVTTYIGTAKVRQVNDGDLELTDPMSYSLINLVITDLSIKSEQSQQKIVNLAQENV